MTSDDRDEHEEATNDLVRFFHALGPAAREAYVSLAARDLAFGEDVAAERRARDQAKESSR